MHPLTSRLMQGAVWLLLAGTLTACAPSLSPLYRDYQVATRADSAEADLYEQIRSGLAEAGWQTAASAAPNVVATEAKTINNWGLYKVKASLEVAPVAEGYVRVFIHPYRYYITGGRSKIPYLRGHLRGAIVQDLNEAFKEQGLVLAGTPFDRDNVSMQR